MNLEPARLASILFVLAAATLAACGDDGSSGGSADGIGNDGDVVGGPCDAETACAEGSECISGGDFPGGMCTVSCSADADCPEGTYCISNEGGICMLPCDSKADCRDGFQCEGKSKEDGAGEKKVCNG
jgi:hypothetical protein